MVLQVHTHCVAASMDGSTALNMDTTWFHVRLSYSTRRTKYALDRTITIGIVVAPDFNPPPPSTREAFYTVILYTFHTTS